MNERLYKGLTGMVVLPCSSKYQEARQEWNRAVQKYPNVIVYCYDNEDVINAILWATCNKFKIRIRSGGHHYEGYSVGNGVIVIDISKMIGIKLDKNKNLLIIQGGVKNQQLYSVISREGYPFPGGTCPTVGVSGYVLGGGWGYSSRYLGLGCDSLQEVEMIDYKGRLIVANKICNSDLFWALKGAGGGNFGIVVSMTFQLPKKVDKVTLVEMYYPNSSNRIMIEFLETWQNWLNNLDERITINSSIYNSPIEGRGIYGRGIFYGIKKEVMEILQPFVEIEGGILNLQEMSFLDAMQKIEATYPDSEKFKSTGRFVYKEYTMDEIKGIIELINERPKGSVFAAISVYALGGKIQSINKKDTAFYYRDAKYIIGIQSVWLDNMFSNNNVQWVNERFKYLKFITEGSYVNFPYSNLINYEKEYFGENVKRLKKVNNIYDPFNIFNFPQGIK